MNYSIDALYLGRSITVIHISAMVFWEPHTPDHSDKRRNGGLDCYCGMADSLFSRVLGPNTFCKNVCDVKSNAIPGNNQTGLLCGGSHMFQGIG